MPENQMIDTHRATFVVLALVGAAAVLTWPLSGVVLAVVVAGIAGPMLHRTIRRQRSSS
jgi:hypothetical protein